MNRRRFLTTGIAGLAAAALPGWAAARSRCRELRITRILVQPAHGRRLTPVAPNAYAPYRGYDRTEAILRIQTAQGLEGFSHCPVPADLLKDLLGLDPFQLFTWTADGRIAGRAEACAGRLQRLGGADVALLDLLGKAVERPVADLLGPRLRESVPVYNSCVYMEDLLTPGQAVNLAYLEGAASVDPVERVARKAAWVLRQPEGFRAIKIKTGRSKWMPGAEADGRDIAVTKAVRAAIGPDVRLFVDGNRDYGTRPESAIAYAEAVRDCHVDFLEELIPEAQAADLRKLRLALRAAGNPVRLASGEGNVGGILDSVYTQTIAGPLGPQPLIDIEQADMNRNGFLHIRSKAALQRPLGMTFAPHNFGSKLGFYAQVHLGLTVPNWEASEIDDVNFPALSGEGVLVQDGAARITGMPGLGVRLEVNLLGAPTVDLRA